VDFDARCENVSWASVRCDHTLDRRGHDVALVVAKIAYHVDTIGNATVTFRPVRFGAAADGHGGLKFPGELVDEKPGTDVALVGTAHPPRGRPVDRALAWVQAGLLRKVITVYGPRRYVATASGYAPGPPGPLEPTPLRFDHCYGGHEHSGRVYEAEPYNPVGRGFAIDPRSLLGLDAPCLEPAAAFRGDPIAAAHRSHGCFAPIPEHFEPRRKLGGTYDAEWTKKRAPIRPRDFDVAHNSWAMPELRSSAPLPPDTPFEIAGVTPEGMWRFKLPRYAVEFESVIRGERRAHDTHLDSVLIDADEHVVELSFRASIRLPRKWEALERVYVRGVGDMPAEALDSEKLRVERNQTWGAAVPGGAVG
jgi:hypothetical protein